MALEVPAVLPLRLTQPAPPLATVQPPPADPGLLGGSKCLLAGAALAAVAAASRGRQWKQHAKLACKAYPLFRTNSSQKSGRQPLYRELGDRLLAEMDLGFDPLELATAASAWGTGAESYYNYREAEVKHGRLAMLAVVGWLSSEEVQQGLGFQDGFVVPDKAWEWIIPTAIAFTWAVELLPFAQGCRSKLLKYPSEKERIPGDLGFDPLFLRDICPAIHCSVARLHNSEVKHGRAAMLAMVVITLQAILPHH